MARIKGEVMSSKVFALVDFLIAKNDLDVEGAFTLIRETWESDDQAPRDAMLSGLKAYEKENDGPGKKRGRAYSPEVSAALVAIGYAPERMGTLDAAQKQVVLAAARGLAKLGKSNPDVILAVKASLSA